MRKNLPDTTKKRTSEKFKCKIDFPLQILRRSSLFKYLWGLPPWHDLFWSVWKILPKIGNFHLFYFPDNYFMFNWFILHIWLQKKLQLIAFLINLWYSSIVSYDAGMTAVNYINRDIENLLLSKSDHRIFLWNLSFIVYLLLLKFVCFDIRSSNISMKFIF